MLLNKHVLAAGFVALLVLGSNAAVWPGHAQYSLGLLDGTDGFRITADASDGRLGYSVSAAGVRKCFSNDDTYHILRTIVLRTWYIFCTRFRAR